jgi:hypothetical protein
VGALPPVAQQKVYGWYNVRPVIGLYVRAAISETGSWAVIGKNYNAKT